MMIVPIYAVPAQKLLVTLNNQPCQIDLRQTDFGLFMTFWLNNSSAPTLANVLCQDRNKISRNSYFGFLGDLAFVDQQGMDDPVYTGLGNRFLLYFLEQSDL